MNKPIFPSQKNIETISLNNLFNLSSPLNITKTRQYLNIDISKNKPIALYQNCLSPDKNFSVNTMNIQDGKNTQNMINKFSNLQKNLKSKMFQSPNTTNSDLLTVASLTSQQSNESLLSTSTANTQYSPNTFQVLIPNNLPVFQFPNKRNTYSMINNYNLYQNNYCYNNNNNPFINGINLRNDIKIKNRQLQGILTNKQKNNNQNIILNNNKSNLNNNKFQKNLLYNNQISTKSNETIEIKHFNSDNSLKSGSGADKYSSSNDNSSKISKNDKKSNNNNNTNNRKFYNKFNSPKDNYTNENTVILTLKLLVAPNDCRIFNLKKYDDLFVSLEKFFDINKINQDLVKPVVNKIFLTLNKIFWLYNNKIGKYDYDYLSSLYRLWIKNNQQIPKTQNNPQKEENKNKLNKNNNHSEKSSDSSDDDQVKKGVKSNSFQNVDSNSEDGKDKTSKSF